MGTNYYAHSDVCEHCGRSDEPLHICKSHISWQAHQRWDETADNGRGDWVRSLDSWQAWKAKLLEPGVRVINEYGDVMDTASFIAEVEGILPEHRRRPYDRMMEAYPRDRDHFLDAEGYSFSSREFT